MNFKIILKAFIIVLVIFFISIISYFIYLKYLKYFTQKTYKVDINNSQSAFKKIDLKRYSDNSDELLKILTSTDYWDNWTWENKMVEAEILDVKYETSEFIIRMSRPTDQIFSKLRRRVKVSCPEDSTIKVSSVNPTSSLSDGGFNIFDQAQKQDIFYSNCLDQNCLNVGKECVLVKMKKANE